MKESSLKKSLYIAGLIFLVNLVIRLLYISDRDIALDEPFTLYYAQMDVKSIFRMLYNENNPPFHFLFLHFWMKFFGMSSLSVRLPSVIFSSFTAVIIYKTGNKFFNAFTGIAAALIFTFSTMHIFFAHEARVYPLFCLLAASILFLFFSIIKKPEKSSNYVWLFLVNTLLIYSHYFGFYVLFIEFISVFFIVASKKTLKLLFVSVAGTGLCYIPMLIIFLHRFGSSTANGTWVAKPGITEVYGNLNRFLNNRYNMAVLILVIGVAFLLSMKNNSLRKRILGLFADRYFKLSFLWFIIPYLFMFLISFKYPMFIDRYILYTSIPFYICIAAAIHHFYENQFLATIAFIVFIGSMIITMQLNPDNNRRLKEVADKVRSLQNESTITFIAPDYAYMGFSYHYNIDYFKAAPNTIELLEKNTIYPVNSGIAVDSILNSVADQKKKNCIYLQAGSEFVDPDNLILMTIAKKYKKFEYFKIFEIYNIYFFHN